MRTSTLAILATFAAAPVAAQDHRELGAHAHGVTTLEIAVEGGIVEIDLRSPGMDIVGFEYEAESAADKDAVAAAIRQLTRPEEILVLDEVAGCRLTEVLARLRSGDDEHEEHDEDHAEHEDHDEDHEQEEHAEDAGHDEEPGQHSEFHAHYAFACDHPEALAAIAFSFFERFPAAREIEARYVTEAGAGSAEIGRDDPQLSLD